MKRSFIVLIILITMLLSGCSLLNDVNESLEYANEATAHINDLSDFAQEAPQMIQQAALNDEVRGELEAQLTILLEEIETFNNIEAPAIAENIHQQLVEKNEIIAQEINQVMENGEVIIEEIENTQIFNTINEITTLLNQLEELRL